MSNNRPPGASPCECCGNGTPGTAIINGLLQMAQLAHFKVWNHKGGSRGSVCLLVTNQNPFWSSSRTVCLTLMFLLFLLEGHFFLLYILILGFC